MATSVPPLENPSSLASPGLSQMERVVDTFIAPSKTFEDIRRSAAWWMPFLISLIISFAFSMTIEKKVGWHQVMENTIQNHPAQQEQLDKLTPEQRAQRESISVVIYRVIAFGYPVFGLIVAAIVAGVLMLTLNLGMGAQAKYWQYFATYIYGVWLPGAIKAILIVILVFAGGGGENFNLENPIGTNLGFYVSNSSLPAALRALLTDIDIFTIWSAVLLALGLSIVCRVSRGKAYGVVFGWWAVIILFGVARAAIFG
jgi:hypothetical protein